MKKLLIISLILTGILGILLSVSAAPLMLRTGTVNLQEKTPGESVAGPAESAYYILQFQGPILENWKAAVRGLGVELFDYIPEYALVAKMDNKQAHRALELSFVRQIERLHPTYRVHCRLLDPVLLSPDALVDVHIEVFPGESHRAVKDAIGMLAGSLHSEGNPAGRFIKATIPAAAVQHLANLESVMWIEEWVQPRSMNNVAQQITGVLQARAQTDLYGQGQILAFADSGLDTGDVNTLVPDLAERLVKAYALKQPNDWSDPTGHGTFVVGVAASSGVLSGSDPDDHDYEGSFAGVAPEAEFIIQAIGDSTGYVYPPLDLATLFQPTYEDGARIHSNSWGSPVYGQYTLYSRQIDQYVWENQDFIAVFPSGNDGADKNSDGVTDLNSMYAPGTAKNSITVGATESVRTTGWNTQYGTAWPADFPAEPLRSDHVSDNANGMVAWSGRGPCSDGRIKPDICAPGTNIISNRTVGGGTGWGIHDSNYMYWAGTSFSTPMIAGAAALVREHCEKNLGIDPSAALIKAFLMNSATDLTPGQYPPPHPVEIPKRPNNVQGWGRLNLLSAIEPEPPCFIEFVDERVGLSTGSVMYSYDVLGSSVPFSATLVWTDPPASPLASKQLVNNLDLRVVTPSGSTRRGNNTIDSTNNVETVDISDPAPGVYRVTVSAVNVPEGPQPFALVVSGQLPGTYVEGSILTSTGKPVSGVSVTIADSLTSKVVTTGSNGRYTTRLAAGTYTVTPAKAGWIFMPESRQITIVDSAVTDVDFTGTAPVGSIGGSIRKTVGGVTNYVVESPHPYTNHSNLEYPVVGHPSASWIRVHFDEISVEEGYDFVVVEDPLGNEVNLYTGTHYDVWSDAVAGNKLVIRLISDEIVTDYGFIADGYQTDIVDLGALGGVKISVEPGGYVTYTEPDGTFEITDLEPVIYIVTPELDNWDMKPGSRTVNVPPGATANGVDFQAFPPAMVEGLVRTGTIHEYAEVIESVHPYGNNEYTVYVLEGPADAGRIRVFFDVINMEPGFDFVYVMDGDDAVVDVFTGLHENVWSSWIDGNTLKIALESDESVTYYGFYASKYEASVDERGVQGVRLTFEPGGRSILTDANGEYLIEDLKVTRYTVKADKAYHTCTPLSCLINTAPGVVTTGVDFYCAVLEMPGIGYSKTLPDGDEVCLAGKIVTAGSDLRPGHLYIQEEDRSSGIKVVTEDTVTEGTIISVSGIIDTNGERHIQAKNIVSSGTGEIPAPLAMVNRSLGGGPMNDHTLGVKNGKGLNNIGLLVRIWGRVISSGQQGPENYFRISDGSDQDGLLVLCRDIEPPAAESLVVVTGISTCRPDGEGGFVRVIEVRHVSDID